MSKSISLRSKGLTSEFLGISENFPLKLTQVHVLGGLVVGTNIFHNVQRNIAEQWVEGFRSGYLVDEFDLSSSLQNELHQVLQSDCDHTTPDKQADDHEHGGGTCCAKF